MKDLPTGDPLMRCECHRDLYPITTATQANHHFAFAVNAPMLLHARLGHLGAPVFQFLRANKDIQCNALTNKLLCYSFQIGKTIKLPFVASSSCIVMSFNIIHNNV